MEVKRYFVIGGICFLCLLGIPIRINKNTFEDDKTLFEKYINDFNKTYRENETEYLIRFQNFRNSLKFIKKLNENRVSNQSALYGLTVFSDLSQDEFIKDRLQTNNATSQRRRFRQSLKYGGRAEETLRKDIFRSKRSSLPMKIDWREKKIVGAVYNQKTCGACWAFSTVQNIESMNALKKGNLVELSVQEAIDCAQNGNYGCEGGDSCSLLHWLVTTKTKITTKKLYPFTLKTDFCNTKNLKTGVQVQNFTCDNFVGSEEKLLEKLAFHGPVAAAINALNWQYYLGGIVQFHCIGEPMHLNHAVQIVGYDRTGPVPFYIARNSWGTEFGDKGYIYIAIGGNICGIADEVTSVDVL